MTDAELITRLMESPVPRDEALAAEGGRRLFPTWQAALVGVPIAIILGAMLGLAVALLVALPLGKVVGDPLPSWFGRVSEAGMLVGGGLGIWITVRWLRGRREQFVRLVRSGTIVAASDVEARGVAGALGTRGGKALAVAALGGMGGTVAQIYGGPIAVGELDGQRVEARTTGDVRGRFRVPELMLVDGGGTYVALLHRAGWVAPQRVLRRVPISHSDV